MVKDPLRAPRAFYRFLFDPVDPAPLATLRIVFGAYLFVYYLSLFPLLKLEYFPPAVMPKADLPSLPSGLLLAILPETSAGRSLLFGITLMSALGLSLGLWTRLSAVLCWAVNQSWAAFPAGRNSGDNAVTVACFLFLVACLSGHAQRAFSLDRRLRKHPPRASPIPAWSLRLFQVQLVFIYFFSGFHKLGSRDWYLGEAMYYVFQQTLWSRIDLTGITGPVAVGAVTYGTLLFELVIFPVLVWPRATRNWVLLGGAIFHLSIAMTMRVFVFGEIMPILYLCFYDSRPWLDWLGQSSRIGRFLSRSTRVPDG